MLDIYMLIAKLQGGTMNKPISTKTHGILDYLSAPMLVALPRLLQWDNKLTNILTGAGLGALGYSVVTRYELGLFKLLPMKWHLALDMMSGAMLAGAAFLLLTDEERDQGVNAILVSIGAYEIAVALLTQPQPSLAEAAHEIISDLEADLRRQNQLRTVAG
jgi:hypothetical protein